MIFKHTTEFEKYSNGENDQAIVPPEFLGKLKTLIRQDFPKIKKLIVRSEEQLKEEAKQIFMIIYEAPKMPT